jgi:hypothetical protein
MLGTTAETRKRQTKEQTYSETQKNKKRTKANDTQ